ncbi:hypothetical protein MKEN_00411600 [Mycena kentingensis (nom. inval.)]|nr:hypothetical protein MKEN_00411600 [Mycena kentingensis (nom. inval.)]
MFSLHVVRILEFHHRQFEPAPLFEIPRASKTTTVVPCDCRYNGGREISLAIWYNHAPYRQGGAKAQLSYTPSARLNKRLHSDSDSDSDPDSNSDTSTDSDSDASTPSRPWKRQRTASVEDMEEDEPGWAPDYAQHDFQARSDDPDFQAKEEGLKTRRTTRKWTRCVGSNAKRVYFLLMYFYSARTTTRRTMNRSTTSN